MSKTQFFPPSTVNKVWVTYFFRPSSNFMIIGFLQININFLQKRMRFLLKLSSYFILLEKMCCASWALLKWWWFFYKSIFLLLQHWNKIKKIWFCYSVVATLFSFIFFCGNRKKIVEITQGRLHFFLYIATQHIALQVSGKQLDLSWSL